MLRALDLEVHVDVADEARMVMARALGPLVVEPSGNAPEQRWRVEPDADLDCWWLRHGMVAPLWARTPEALVGPLVHELNHLVARRSRCVALHAGGVTHGGHAVVVPGPMESGKSTLTAGLVRAGFGYLSDEAVGISDDTGDALAYPKPLALDIGAQALFPELAARAAPYSEDPGGPWHVPVDGAWPRPAAAPARLLVFSRYRPGAATVVTPMSRADAVVEAARSTFRFRERSRRSLDTLTRMVRGADCYLLVTGDLDPAIDVVVELAEAVDQ